MALSPPFEGSGFDKFNRGLDHAANKVGNFAGDLLGVVNGDNGPDFGFGGRTPPSPSGTATRQAQVPPLRDGVTTRQVMKWIIPEQPLVEMYVNPKQIQYIYKKLINKKRVKGGYILQYWGEDLTQLNISGTTGTSGIEGINVLMDVYRNEQLMFDPYALFLQAERDKANQESSDDLLFGEGGLFGLDPIIGAAADPILGLTVGAAADQIQGSLESNIVNSRTKPTLASLAFTVEMYWSGEVYRGYFENFTFDENAERIGLFDYNFTFNVTQKRGFRNNFFAWHKHPSYGQSNWDAGGPPLSYGKSLGTPYATATGRTPGTPVATGGNRPFLEKVARAAAGNIKAFDI
jgi:hypothetical protein